MKIALLSLVIAVLVALLSVFQFERYQKFVMHTENQLAEAKAELALSTKTLDEKIQSLKNCPVIEAKAEPAEAPNQTPASTVNVNVTEAERLVRLAIERLLVASDIETAEKLLSAADNSIQATNDPSLNDLRAALAKDRVALESIKAPDTDGLWLTAGALIKQIPSLPTRGIRTAAFELKSAEPSVASPPTTPWKEALLNTWHGLRELIKVQRHSKPIDPVLPLAEVMLAHEHLSLILEEARWAILHANDTVFQASLAEAKNWLDTYFENTDEKVKSFNEALTTLGQTKLKPELPDIQSTLSLFQGRKGN